jgi:hypothetical protein
MYGVCFPKAEFPVSQTTSHSIDLGVLRLGRIDGPRPVLPTNLTFHVTGASPFQPGERVFIDSFSNAAESIAFVPGGATGLDPFVLDWRDTGAPLLNAAEGDDLFVVHQTRSITVGAGQNQRTIAEAFSTRSVTLFDGVDASVTGVFGLPTASSQSVQFSPASYVQGHAARRRLTRQRSPREAGYLRGWHGYGRIST